MEKKGVEAAAVSKGGQPPGKGGSLQGEVALEQRAEKVQREP